MSDDEKPSGEVLQFGKPKLVEPGELTPNPDTILMVEGVLARVKSGDSQAVAFIEVKPGGRVATGWTGSEIGWYHQLNSGAARLANRLANDEGTS